MDRAQAERIASLTAKLNLIFGECHMALDALEDETERKMLKRALGELILDTHEKISLPVANQFPDLHPDKS
jgi:hypothetical protein